MTRPDDAAIREAHRAGWEDRYEAIRAVGALAEAAMSDAQQQWDRLMDARRLPNPMGAYKVLNIHYPQPEEWLGRATCIHCHTAWPCAPFAELEARYPEVTATRKETT